MAKAREKAMVVNSYRTKFTRGGISLEFSSLAEGVFNYQADRILRTEGARVSGRQQAHDIKQAGFDKMEWIASAGACNHCAPLDGKVFRADKFGEDPYVLPFHPNCRCSVVAVM